MNATVFDTLSAARDIEAAGLDRRQAEAIAAAIRAAQGELATRADLDSLRTATRADFAAAVAELRADLYRALWIQGAGLAAVFGGLIAAAGTLGLL